MSELVPMGYLSRLEAIDAIAGSLVAGTPDRPHVTKQTSRTETRSTKPMRMARTVSASAWMSV